VRYRRSQDLAERFGFSLDFNCGSEEDKERLAYQLMMKESVLAQPA